VKLKTVDAGDKSILLFDGKGRPGKPARPHPLPLIAAAQKSLKAAAPTGVYALSTDGGDTHISAATLSHWAVEAATGIADFQTKRLRSGVETLLASSGVSMEARGRLQSHGVSGVQATHYDAHDYMPDKRNALEVLYRELTGKSVARKRA